MLNELNALESKIAQVVALCRTLRTENDGCASNSRCPETDKERLAERMAAACARLEQLAQQLPEAKSLKTLI
jgi:cell division protein ZapB